MKNLIHIALLVFVITNTSSAENIKLFKEYTYDMSFKEAKNIKGMFDCSDLYKSKDKMLCIEGIKFAGMNGAYSLLFLHNRLKKISFLTEYSQENYLSTFNALLTKFTLVEMQGENGNQDFFEIYNKDKKNFGLNINNFEKTALQGKKISYIFFEKKAVTNKEYGKYKNTIDALNKFDINIREADMHLISDDSTQFIIVDFILPKRNIQNFVNPDSKVGDF